MFDLNKKLNSDTAVEAYDLLYKQYMRSVWKVKDYRAVSADYYKRISFLIRFRRFVHTEKGAARLSPDKYWSQKIYDEVIEMIEENMDQHSIVYGKPIGHWKQFIRNDT